MKGVFCLLKCLCLMFFSFYGAIGQEDQGTVDLTRNLQQKIENADRELIYDYSSDRFKLTFHELKLERSNYYQKTSMGTSAGRRMYGNITDIFIFFTGEKYKAKSYVNSKYYQLEVTLLEDGYEIEDEIKNDIINDVAGKLELKLEVKKADVEALCIYLEDIAGLKKYRSKKFNGSVFTQNKRSVKFEGYKIEDFTTKFMEVFPERIQFVDIPQIDDYFDLKFEIGERQDFLNDLKEYGFNYEKCQTTIYNYYIVGK